MGKDFGALSVVFFSKNKKRKKLKLFLLSIILIMLSAVTIVFIKYRQVMDTHSNLMPIIQGKANIAIGKVHQTATRDGIKEWSLEASSARYVDTEKIAIFEDLFVTFYLKDEQEVHLTADQGRLQTDSNNIEVAGNVEVKNDRYRLLTENLHFEHEKRVISSKVPVKIFGDFFDLSANAITLELNTKNASLDGNVVGTFNEKIRL